MQIRDLFKRVAENNEHVNVSEDGKPHVADHQVPVTDVLKALAGGMTIEEIAKEHDLTEDEVTAALEYTVALFSVSFM